MVGLHQSQINLSAYTVLHLQLQCVYLFVCVLQGEKNQWQMRRSQKVDKQEILTLQANLQAEIQAKQQLSEEMNKIKAANVANER